jgi:hypothetical protein
MMIRRGTGGLYVNGVVTRYSVAGIAVVGDATNTRATEGNLAIRNVYVSQIATSNVFHPAGGTGDGATFAFDLTANNITAGTAQASALFTALPTTSSATTAANFDWTPAAGSPIATGGLTSFTGLPAALQARTQGFVTATAYRGAAAPNGPRWWEGWTNYARN